MAAAAHFTARVYGSIQGAPPFTSGGVTAFTKATGFDTAQLMSFPTAGTTISALPNGFSVGGAYVYSVIEVAASGLNKYPAQYVTDSSFATLATNAG